jgi:anti-sigma regulatory factor (Ser/Thr protein kinase)
MDTLLIDRWLGGAPATPVHDEASVVVLREEARRAAHAQGLDETNAGAVAIVVGELANNHLAHARGGSIALRSIVRDGVPGIEIVAVDRGDGIADPTAAIDGTSTRPGGLGIGLAGTMRLADEVDVDVRIGAGTCVVARKFARRPARRREWAVICRPCEDERVSGDDAFVARDERGLFVVVADGLGHGPDARAPASAATEIARAARGESTGSIFERADEALAGTRGTTLSVVDIDEPSGSLRHAGVGNVVTHVVGARGSRSFVGSATIVGQSRAARALSVAREQCPIDPGDVVIVATDGLRTALTIDADLRRRHPILVAHHLLKTHGRDNDDATVVVVA